MVTKSKYQAIIMKKPAPVVQAPAPVVTPVTPVETNDCPFDWNNQLVAFNHKNVVTIKERTGDKLKVQFAISDKRDGASGTSYRIVKRPSDKGYVEDKDLVAFDCASGAITIKERNPDNGELKTILYITKTLIGKNGGEYRGVGTPKEEALATA